MNKRRAVLPDIPVEQSASTLIVVAHPKLRETGVVNAAFRSRSDFMVVPASSYEARTMASYAYLPAIVLADESFFQDGPEGGRASAMGPNGKVLVFGPSASDPRVIASLLLAGAAGYLSEDVSAAMIRKAVLTVQRGEYWVSRSALSELVRSLLSVQSSPRLTPRELEVLELLSDNQNNRTIARILGITHETVRWHLRAIYTKLGVRDRVSAVDRAENLLGAPLRLRPSRREWIAEDSAAEAAV